MSDLGVLTFVMAPVNLNLPQGEVTLLSTRWLSRPPQSNSHTISEDMGRSDAEASRAPLLLESKKAWPLITPGDIGAGGGDDPIL